MKLLAAALLLSSLGQLPAAAQPAAQKTSVEKTRFFRPHWSRRSRPEKPHATNGPVIVNSASFEPGISPGGLVTIFGNDLTTVSGVVVGNTNPLPTHLAGVSVYVGGYPAPIFSIAYSDGQDQISVQVPYEAPIGPDAAEIQVFDQGAVVADFFTDSFTEDPGIFTYGNNIAIATKADYSLVSESNPASPGEPMVLYVTGLGPLDQDLTDGYGAPTIPPFATTLDPFQVIVDGEACDVFFSGLAPGFVGLYQINFYVPADAAEGDLQISIQSQYANSATAILPVD
jgi:minor extracellular serine protease Vpr